LKLSVGCGESGGGATNVSRAAHPTKLPKVFALLWGHASILLRGHETTTEIGCLRGGSRTVGTTISRRLRRSKSCVGTTLLGVNLDVPVNIIHSAAVLGSTDLPNRKLTVGILLRQFKFILTSLPLLAANLTKLLTVGLNSRQGAFANRANKAGVARASNTKTGLDKRHVDGFTPASGRINALFTHTISNAAHPIREKGRILSHKLGHRRQLTAFRNSSRGVP
jgi:hypothetical protein